MNGNTYIQFNCIRNKMYIRNIITDYSFIMILFRIFFIILDYENITYIFDIHIKHMFCICDSLYVHIHKSCMYVDSEIKTHKYI